MNAEETKFIEDAAKFFEDQSVFTKMLNSFGNVIEGSIEKLPEKMKTSILSATTTALKKCLQYAIWTTDSDVQVQSVAAASEKSSKQTFAHSAAAAVAGGLGGFFGAGGMIIELPLTTTLLMRSIAKTANEFGHDTNNPEVFLECLYVFTLGGPGKADDGANSAYIGSRLAFNKLVRGFLQVSAFESAKELLGAFQKGTVPGLAKLLSVVAERFGVRISEKFLAEATPIVGAVGGAGINIAFNQYFSTAAKYHFGMKNLERSYGQETVRKLYESSAKQYLI